MTIITNYWACNPGPALCSALPRVDSGSSQKLPRQKLQVNINSEYWLSFLVKEDNILKFHFNSMLWGHTACFLTGLHTCICGLRLGCALPSGKALPQRHLSTFQTLGSVVWASALQQDYFTGGLMGQESSASTLTPLVLSPNHSQEAFYEQTWPPHCSA